MTKLVLTEIGSTLTNTAATQINANNAAIVTAVENTLSRDGSTPNSMSADIDMNNNDLLNVNRLDVESLFIDGEGVQSVNIATALKISNNLSDVANAATSRINLGLTDTATAISTAFGKSLIDDVDAAAAQTTLGISTFVKTILDDATASAVMSTLGISAFIQTLMDDGTAAEARATLGLTIGTNVQAFDAGLQSISGLTTAADTMIYTTALDTYATTTLTAYGRSLIDDADATAARSTLGLGTMATQAASGVAITGGSVTGITDITVADGGTGASTAAGARTNLGLVIGTDVQAFRLVGSATFDPPSLADGAGTSTTVTVTGAALGDFAIPSFSLDLQGITVTAYVSSANTCTVRFQNESGGVLDLASGTLRVAVFK